MNPADVSGADLDRLLREAGLRELSERARTQFGSYLELLLKWNARLNLTAIREPEAILRRHFVECIQCAQALPALPSESTLLDYGSGAGLPGIPIAICRPEIRVTLAESQGKKAAFLSEAVRQLGISAEVFNGRVENMPGERRFSAVTLRAVDRMAEACREAAARVAPEGWMVVFATAKTGEGLMQAIPEISWKKKLKSSGLDEGEILFGQRAK